MRVALNRCLNKEVKYYGLKATGLVFGGLVGLVVMIKFDFTVGIFGSVVGYVLGAGISSYWHKGYIQRWCYWNLPTQLIASSKYLPKSCDRKLL